MIRKAIIPAAGLGTRFLPATKAQPKEMLPIVDTPCIQYIVKEAIESGITDIIIVTGKSKRAIEDHFDHSVELELTLEENGKNELLKMVRTISTLVDIHYIRQKRALGLGHAVLCARKFIGNEPFALLLGDDIIDSNPPCTAQMIADYKKYRTSILGTQMVPDHDVDKYGIVDGKLNDQGVFMVSDLVEKPSVDQAPSNRAIIGRYILEPEIFSYLENQRPGAGGEIQLTDALRELNQWKPMVSHTVSGTRYDVGDKFGYIRATIEFALKREDLKTDVSNYLESLYLSNFKCK